MQNSLSLCQITIRIPESWGGHLKVIVITILVIVAIALGIDIMP